MTTQWFRDAYRVGRVIFSFLSVSVSNERHYYRRREKESEGGEANRTTTAAAK